MGFRVYNLGSVDLEGCEVTCNLEHVTVTEAGASITQFQGVGEDHSPEAIQVKPFVVNAVPFLSDTTCSGELKMRAGAEELTIPIVLEKLDLVTAVPKAGIVRNVAVGSSVDLTFQLSSRDRAEAVTWEDFAVASGGLTAQCRFVLADGISRKAQLKVTVPVKKRMNVGRIVGHYQGIEAFSIPVIVVAGD